MGYRRPRTLVDDDRSRCYPPGAFTLTSTVHMQYFITLAACALLLSAGCSSKTQEVTQQAAPSQTVKQPSASPSKETSSASTTEQAGTKARRDEKERVPSQPTRPTVDLRQVTLEAKDQRATVQFVLPTQWSVTTSGPTEVKLTPPRTVHEDYVQTSCRMVFGLRECVDLCTTEHTLAGLNGSWPNWLKQWVEPATRTGKPAKNIVERSWKGVTDEQKEGFRLVSGHLTYPENAKKEALVRDRIVTRCTKMNLGDTVSIDAECRGSLAFEKSLRRDFEAICRSLAVTQQPSTARPAETPSADTDDSTSTSADRTTFKKATQQAKP